MMKISSKLLAILKESESFLIAGHINPEGDSIGSCLALALGLKKMGKKKVSVISKDPVPENLKFLPSSGMIRRQLPRGEVDAAVLIDCNSMERTGFSSFRAKNTVIIDHHLLPSSTAESNFFRSVQAKLVDSGAAAAAVLVYRVLKALNVPINQNISTCLYTAVLVDTGGFRYSNASPDALKTAFHLVEAGARPWNIAKELYENIPFRSVKLLGLSLSTLERNDGIAWITTTREMFEKTGTSAEDCEDFVDFPRKVKNVEVAVFFRQADDDLFKLSLRSKGRVNVQKIAKVFGGGGHAAAAGCKIRGALEDVQSRVFRVIRKAIRETRR